MTQPAHPTLGGLDPWRGQWDGTRTGHLNNAIKAIREANLQALGAGIEALGALTDEDMRRLSGAVAQYFRVDVAELLESQNALDRRALMKRQVGLDLLRWILLDPAHVELTEEATHERGSYRGNDKKRANLGQLLARIGTDDPNTTMRGLLESDLVAVVRNHHEHGYDNIHLGMETVGSITQNVPHRYLDLDLLVRFIDRCLERDILESMMGRALDDEELLEFQARNLDQLISAGVGESVNDDTLSKHLLLLNMLCAQSPTIARAVEHYWTVQDDDMPEIAMTQNEKNGFIGAQGHKKIQQEYPSSWRANSVVEAVLRQGNPQSKQDLLKEGPSTALFWEAMKRGPTLATAIRNAGFGNDLKPMRDACWARLGPNWRDENGNNLVHLWAWAPYGEERMILIGLAKTAAGARLFTTQNNKGETPLDIIQRQWQQQGGEFHQRMKRTCARHQKETLTKTAKEQGASSRQRDKPRM